MIRLLIRPADASADTPHDLTAEGLEFGRGQGSGPAPRFVLAGDPHVSRSHLRLEPRGADAVRAVNLSTSQAVYVKGEEPIAPGGERVFTLPAAFAIGRATVRAESVLAEPVESTALVSKPPRKPLAEARDPLEMAGWFEAVLAVHRAAPGSDEFYAQTARALVDLIGLDVGLVLLRRPTGWGVVARAAGPGAPGRGREFSTNILRQMEESREALCGEKGMRDGESLSEVESLVAAPVFGADGAVVGAVYGTRWRTFRPGASAIGPLEAQMVRVLATAVGAGLARAEQEAEAARLKVQFRQFFSDQLARELERDPAQLEGQDREATFLFADIAGFSAFSERVGPRDTFRLVGSVMEALTEAVHGHEGVVMDYVGDELIALWNAPADVPDHPRHAAVCALALDGALERVNKEWAARLGAPVRVTVGINTGVARVGNTGTRYKFKYGALGHTVNLASRVQGATKAFGVPVLAAGPTRNRLPADFPARKLGRVKVLGVGEPVEVHELPAAPGADWYDVRVHYERALELFEAGNFRAAASVASELAASEIGRNDGPAHFLAAQAAELAVSGATGAGVFQLRAK